MSLFIKKIILYLGLFFVIVSVITSSIYYFFDNAIWGYSDNLEQYRLNELITRGGDYNLVVFGSSYSDLHINTPYLDELNGGNTNSFNAAQWGTSPGNIIKVMETMLPNIPNAKVVVVDVFAEIRDIDSIKDSRFRYTLTFKGWFDIVKNIFLGHKLMQSESSIVNMYEVTKIFISKILGVGIIGHVKKDYQSRHVLLPENNLSKNIHDKKGYVFKFTDDRPGRKKILDQLENNFAQLENVRDKKIKNNKKAFDGDYDVRFNSEYEYQRFSQVAKLYKDSGKKVIFFIYPLNGTASYNAVEIGKRLEGDGYTVIPFLDAEKYPELFDLKYWYDVGHLNYEGGIKFTEYLYKNIVEFLP